MRANRTSRTLYYWYIPARMAFVYGWALSSFLIVQAGHGGALRYGAGISLILTSVLAGWALRRMRQSRHEAGALQEAHASAQPPYMAIGLVLVALTIIRGGPPAGDLVYALVYLVVGWFVASLNAKNLTIYGLWMLGMQDHLVARTPYWFSRLRGRIPGVDGDGFFGGRR